MKFSSPEELDDPLEVSDKLISVVINEESIKYFSNLDRSHDPEAPTAEFIENEMRFAPEAFQNRIKNIFTGLRKTQGIRSFSELPNISPMWGTYAKSHTGICIGFDTRALVQFLYPYGISIGPVDYSTKLQPTDFLTRGKEAVYKWMHTKHQDWQYQKEIRAWSDQAGILQFPPQLISRVYFGNKTPDEKITHSVQKLKAKGINGVRLAKMEFDSEGNMLGRTIAY